MSSEASSEASTSARKLPSRKIYITALSTLAFVSGLGIATVVTIRRGRRMKLEEMQAKRAKGKQYSEVISPQRLTIPVKDDSILGAASSRGPIVLFREMNRAAFGRRPLNQSDDPHVSRLRGTAAKASVFDSTASVAPPSALRRGSAKSKVDIRVAPEAQTEVKILPEQSTKEAAGRTEDMGESPVVMAVKAIGIATALVGAGAYVAWEIARRLLGVRDLDDFIDKLATAIPSKAKDKQALSSFGGSARASLKHRSSLDGEDDVIPEQYAEGDPGAPLPIHEALQALDDAASRGEASTWIEILSRQLNAEREQDLEQRRQRRAKQHPNAMQGQVLV